MDSGNLLQAGVDLMKDVRAKHADLVYHHAGHAVQHPAIRLLHLARKRPLGRLHHRDPEGGVYRGTVKRCDSLTDRSSGYIRVSQTVGVSLRIAIEDLHGEFQHVLLQPAGTVKNI